MVHAALLLLMLEAVTKDLVFTISLKRSTQNLQLSTSWPGRLPHLRLLPAGAVAGWGLHPLESAALSRRTPEADMHAPCLWSPLSALIAGEAGLDRMLYEAERHESLTASAWNEQAARACINEILDDAVDKFSARDLWPSHPLDSFSPDARWNLYIGAAG